jgi:hypothetical protein
MTHQTQNSIFDIEEQKKVIGLIEEACQASSLS